MLKPYEQRFPWNLDWNLLRTFMVVVEQRGVTRAADFLGLKQPTVSSALKRLEATTGHRLIIRNPNLFRVTQAGELLYSECSTIFGAVSQLPTILDSGKEELRGQISVVLASHVVCPHFDTMLNAFAERHRKVNFAFSVADSFEVQSRVTQNRASFGICLLPKIPAKLECTVLYREFFGLYCGARHPLFSAGNIELEDLEGEPAVAFQTEVEGGALDSVAGLRERVKLAPGWRGVSSNLPELRRMIVTNVGIGALPVHVAERDVSLGNLRQLPPHDNLPVVDIYLVTNPRRRLSDAEAVLLAAIRRMMRDTPMEDRTYDAGG